MLKVRVIPILLWNGREAVQSVSFKRPHRPVGSMMQHIENMEAREIDELIILDVEATREGREPLYKEIQEYTSKLFCPLTVGGGINDLSQIERLLQSGADKVAINHALYTKPGFIYEAARKFGSQCIVASINCVSRYELNKDRTYIDVIDSTGRMRRSNRAQAKEICKYAEELGAGEILLTDVHKNGTYEGYNYQSITECSYDIAVPLICYGGCGEPRHMVEGIRAGASAVAASSMFLFRDYTPKNCSRMLDKNGIPARL